MSTITLNNLSKSFGSVLGVNKANLNIEDGKIYVFVGPSGCGKTTTLRMIAGLEKPTSGEIYFDGSLANHVSPVDRNVAMVFQNFALYPHLSVRENITLSLKVKKVNKTLIEKKLQEIAVMLNIEQLLDRKPAELSGGQKQRVAVGRAIIRDPNVLLMDEPLSNLDAKLRLKMRAELKDLISRIGVTTVYVTHDQVEAMTLGDVLVVMNNGEIQQVGSAMDIYNYPRNIFVAGMIGSTPMNFWSGVIVKEAGSLYFKTEEMSYLLTGWDVDDLSGREVVLGVRPKDIRIVTDPVETPSERRFKGKMKIREEHGDETLFHLTAGQRPITMVVDPGLVLKATRGDNLSLTFMDETIHLFDAETEERIERIS